MYYLTKFDGVMQSSFCELFQILHLQIYANQFTTS